VLGTYASTREDVQNYAAEQDGACKVARVIEIDEALDEEFEYTAMFPQADELGRNHVHMYIDAGIVYYLTVNAGDTMGVDLDYRLTVTQLAN